MCRSGRARLGISSSRMSWIDGTARKSSRRRAIPAVRRSPLPPLLPHQTFLARLPITQADDSPVDLQTDLPRHLKQSLLVRLISFVEPLLTYPAHLGALTRTRHPAPFGSSPLTDSPHAPPICRAIPRHSARRPRRRLRNPLGSDWGAARGCERSGACAQGVGVAGKGVRRVRRVSGE